MTDVNNDRGPRNDDGQNPPPLVPPPVRRNDTGEQIPADGDQARPIGSDEPVFVEPTTERTDDRNPDGRTTDDGGPNGTRAYEPAVTDAQGDERPADPAYAEQNDAGRDPSSATATSARGEDRGEDADDDDDVDDRDPDAAEQPYQPVSARSDSDDAAYAPVQTRATDNSATENPTTDDSATGDRANAPVSARAGDDTTARRDVQDTSADAEAVAVAAPSTSPSAPPQPVFVPATDGGTERTDGGPERTDGGTERTAGFPPATGQQREFVQPPVAPKKKGNRGVGSLIALLSVILFAVVYALVAVAIIAAQEPQSLTDIFTNFVVNPLFWVPAIIFVVAFIIVVLLANRATWWAYVLGSLLVGALVYFGTIGVALVGDNVFGMSPSEAFDRFLSYVPNPFIIAAGLVAREVSLWTGSAIAARGRRMKERNITARTEYERASAEHRAEYERTYSPAA